MRSSPVVRDLVYGAFDDAVGAVGSMPMAVGMNGSAFLKVFEWENV